MTEQESAEKLVWLLLRRHGLDSQLILRKVWVEPNNKIKFLFESLRLGMKDSRHGTRPGLEMEWDKGQGDVDGWNPKGGDLVSLFGHLFQVLRESHRKAEKPSRLLKIALKQEAKNRA